MYLRCVLGRLVACVWLAGEGDVGPVCPSGSKGPWEWPLMTTRAWPSTRWTKDVGWCRDIRMSPQPDGRKLAATWPVGMSVRAESQLTCQSTQRPYLGKVKLTHAWNEYHFYMKVLVNDWEHRAKTHVCSFFATRLRLGMLVSWQSDTS